MTFETVTGPACWASYFINGDASGLTDAEKSQADAWLKREGIVNVVSCADEAHFTWALDVYAPELGFRGGDVIEYTVELKEEIPRGGRHHA